MTVLADHTLPRPPAADVDTTTPRVLRAVPTEPPYDEGGSAGAEPTLPLALAISRRSSCTVLDLPTFAVPAEDPATEADRRAVDAELRRLFGRQRTARSELPAPAPRAAAAVRLLLEVLAGERPARHVARWVAPGVLRGLERSADRRAAYGRRPRLQSLRVTEPADAVAEVSAVVALGERMRAVALRLEGLDGRWTVTALHVG